MSQTLMCGVVGEATTIVTLENTAEKFGNHGAMVFATPFLVGLMEQAAIAAVRGYLAEGEGTVGTRLEIDHIAATPVGMNVRAVAKLREIDGKRLIFDVEAWDDAEKVGQGQHERFIISSMKFLNKVEEKSKKR
ncbi:MAG: hypothetical protein H6Q73_3420 [Firmicutes bacterium]|nr:hypothetical protein [Bacillota bacterium]